MTKRKRGRPRGQHRPVLSTVLSARVNPEFLQQVKASAKAGGRTVSEEVIWRAWQSYKSEAARGFCPYCGSHIEEQNKSPKWQIPAPKVANSKIGQ